MSIKKIKIFISSPGDVGQERLLTRRTIERLQGEFKAYVTLEPILWEHEPLRATEHFQEQIILPSSTDIVICILWSRLGTRLPEKFKKQDGSNYSSGTEWEFEDAAKAYSEKRIPDLLVYRKTEDPPINMKDNTSLCTLEQKNALDIFLNKWFGNPQNGFEAAFHTFNDLDEFENKLDVHLRKLILNRIPEHLFKEDVTLSWFSGSPYMGLEAFDIEHSSVFYGRTREVGKIKEALYYQATMGCAFLMVLGKSGCGKSSLIRAGIIPNITQSGVIEGIEYWRQAYFRPGNTQNDILQSFAIALLQKEALDDSSNETAISKMEKYIKEDKEAFIQLVEEKLLKLKNQEKKSKQLLKLPETRFIVFIDQMEEIFTMENITEEERKEFISVLSMLARSGFVWIIATMRSDFYSRSTELPELIAMKEGKGHYDLLPPTISEIGQIIRQPAKASGIKFEKNVETGESLDEIILQTALSNTGILPLLEFTLDELYKKREENILTFEAYKKMGGLEGAIASKAEEVLEKLPQEVSNSLPLVFRQLITIQTNDENVISSRMAEINRENWSWREHQLIEEFIEARLLVTDNMSDGKAIVSIAHEALIYNWPRLQNIINEDRDFLRIRARVMDSEDRWEKENKNSDFLLPEGKPLFEADYLLKNRIMEIEVSLVTYIKESIKKSRRKKRNRILGISLAFAIIMCFSIFSFSQWQIANAQTQLANTEKARAETNAIEAESQKQKAENNAKEALSQQQLAEANSKEAKSQKQMAETNAKEALSQKQMAETNAKEALLQKQMAETNAKEALSQKQIAEEQTGIAEEQKAEAVKQKNNAIEQRDNALISQSLFLAKMSNQQADIGNSDVAMLLALKGLPNYGIGGDRPLVQEAQSALSYSIIKNRSIYKTFKHSSEIFDVNFTSDGSKIIAASSAEYFPYSGDAYVWDVQNGNMINKFDGIVSSANIQITSDGNRVVFGESEKYSGIEIRDSSNFNVIKTVKPSISGMQCYELYNNCIFLGFHDGTIMVHNYENGQECTVLKEEESPIEKIKLSKDGKYMVYSFRGGNVKLLDLTTNKSLSIIENLSYSECIDIEISDNDIYTVLSNGTVSIYNIISGNKSTVFNGNYNNIGDHVRNVKISYNNKYLLVNYDKKIELWDLNKKLKLDTLVSYDVKINAARFSYDDSMVAVAKEDGSVDILKIENEIKKSIIIGNQVLYDKNKQRCATIFDNGDIEIYDVLTGNLLDKLNFITTKISSAIFTSSGNEIVLGMKDGTVCVIDTTKGKDMLILNGLNTEIQKLVVDKERNELIAGSQDGAICVWEFDTGNLIKKIDAIESYEGISDLKYNNDGTRIAVVRYTGVEIIDTSNWTKLNSYKCIDPYDFEFIKDGNYFVVAQPDGLNNSTIRLFNSKTKECIQEFKDVFKSCISKDSKYLSLSYNDGSVELWNLEKLKKIKDFKFNSNYKIVVKFSTDSNILALGLPNGIIELYSTNNGTEINALQSNEISNSEINAVDSIVFSEDDKNIAINYASGYMAIWSLSNREVLEYFKDDQYTSIESFIDNGNHIITKYANGIKVWKVFNNTNEIIDFANKKLNGRTLSDEELIKFGLK